LQSTSFDARTVATNVAQNTDRFNLVHSCDICWLPRYEFMYTISHPTQET
jgi:hypothetical protein